MRRICRRCNQIREADQFAPSRHTHGYCRPCQSSKDKTRFKPELRDAVDAYKLKLGCAQCGYKTSAKALQFDHLDPTTKEDKVSRYVKQGCTERAWQEIAKCQVLCANCHSIKTFYERDHGAA